MAIVITTHLTPEHPHVSLFVLTKFGSDYDYMLSRKKNASHYHCRTVYIELEY